MTSISRSTTLVARTAATVLLFSACTDISKNTLAPAADPSLLGSAIPGSGTTAGPGRYLIGVVPGQSVPANVLAAAGAVIIDSLPVTGVYEVNAATPAALKTSTALRYVEPSSAISIDAIQSDVISGGGDATPDVTAFTPDNAPFFTNHVQWDMTSMKADYGWSHSSGGSSTNVCIIDTGIDGSHQELTGKVVKDTSFVPNSPAPLDSNGHGTHVSSTVTSNSRVMSSVAPYANLMAAKVFAATGSTPSLRVQQAIVWCADKGAHVINMSLGGITFYPTVPLNTNVAFTSYADAVKYATDRGVVVVVSAGNSNIKLPNPSVLVTPAQVPGTIIVGATGPLSKSGKWSVGGTVKSLPLSPNAGWDPTSNEQTWFPVDSKAFYTNYGTGVDVFAPGGIGSTPSSYVNRIVFDQSTPAVRVQQVAGPNDNVWAACSKYSTFSGSANAGGVPGASAVCRTTPTTPRYASLAGTSMAAPHVAGLAAVLYGELAGGRSTANRAKIESCIRSSADNVGPSSTFGNGRVNVQSALACVRGQNLN